jgi:hypothetical protein
VRPALRGGQAVGLHSAALLPSSRAASSGCGVSMVAGRGRARRSACQQAGSAAMAFSASASSTSRAGVASRAGRAAHGVAAAAAAHHGVAPAGRRRSHQAAAPHQPFGPGHVRRGVGVQRAAGRRARHLRPGGACGQPGGAAHARRAADDGMTSPKLPLCCACCGGAAASAAAAPASQARGGAGPAGDAQVSSQTLPAWSRPLAGEQPGLEASAGQRGVARTACVAQQAAGVAVQAGGQVDRQHRARDAWHWPSMASASRPSARGWRPRPSSASISRSKARPAGSAGVDGHACGLRLCQAGGVGGQTRDVGHSVHLHARQRGAGQWLHQTVAAVVARPGQHPHRPRMRRQASAIGPPPGRRVASGPGRGGQRRVLRWRARGRASCRGQPSWRVNSPLRHRALVAAGMPPLSRARQKILVLAQAIQRERAEIEGGRGGPRSGRPAPAPSRRTGPAAGRRARG